MDPHESGVPSVPSFPFEMGDLHLERILREAAEAPVSVSLGALRHEGPIGLEEAAALLVSPMEPVFDELFDRTNAVRRRVFGRSILLYAHCYVSSFCTNQCTYCGFHGGDTPREWRSPARVAAEVSRLARPGLNRVVLVASEATAIMNPRTITETLQASCGRGVELDLLVGPAESSDYEDWKTAGAAGVLCYQETYDPLAYAFVHRSGPKTEYHTRLATLERAGRAGVGRLGLGVLLGLSEPKLEILALIAHAQFLHRAFPESRISIGIPRLQWTPYFRPPFHVDDLDLLRYFAVLRLALPDASLAVTTREPEWLRGRLLSCATEMSVRSSEIQSARVECSHDGGDYMTLDWRSAELLRWQIEDLGYEVPRNPSGKPADLVAGCGR